MNNEVNWFRKGMPLTNRCVLVLFGCEPNPKQTGSHIEPKEYR